MDYMFYTPPNTAPDIDHSVPFDSVLAQLEGQHYMASQELADAQERFNAPIDPDLEAEDQAQIQARLSNDVESAKARVNTASQQITAARATKQADWDAYRAERAAEEPTA